MSKKVKNNTANRVQPAPLSAKPHKAAARTQELLLRRPLLWLILASVIIYFPTISYGLTDLDDGIFINTFSDYNENIGNLITSFQRGLFDAVKDTYYRPVFFDVMILNYQLSGHGQNLALYHAINIIFHVASVVLLYRLLVRLNIKPLHAFILSLIFAVHPVLSQAVAWIPGRNDTMLAICVFSFLNMTIDYVSTGKIRYLAMSAVFLLLAYFTKETAVVAAPFAFLLIVFILKHKWLEKRLLILYGLWILCFVTWFVIRAHSTINTATLVPATMLHDLGHKLPLLVQYMGKIIIPANLSVFATIEDAGYVYGIAAIVVLIAALALSKKRDLTTIFCGLGIFVLLLAPILIIPDFLNLQAFEHRLYLPIVGILLVLSQTALFQNFKDRTILTAGISISFVLAAVNFYHQASFKDPLAFWSQAVRSSPHSAYSNMMLAARVNDPQRSNELFLTAYKLNPNERLLNFIYGFMLQDKDSILASEKYFLAEKKNSGYYPCDFYLARVEMEKKNFPGAIQYLETFLQKEPKHPLANNNLLFLYIDTQQFDKAKALAKKMQQSGVELSPEARKELNM